MEQFIVQERISNTSFNDVISPDSVKDVNVVTDIMRNIGDDIGVFQFMTNFVGVEVTKAKYNIRVPVSFINTASIAITANVTESFKVEDIGRIDINNYTRFDTDRKLLVTVNDIIGKNGSIPGYMGPMHSKKFIKEFFRYQRVQAPDPVSNWNDFSSMDYKDFYAACRVIAFYSGWIGATGNVELCITDDEIPVANYSAEEIDKITFFVKTARSALIAKAMNFWLTNHNTGQGKMTYFMSRALKLAGVFKPDFDLASDVMSDLTTDIYNAVHFADVRNILFSILGNSIENGYTFTAMIASGFFAPRKHAIDGFISPRISSAPSGVARVFVAHAGLREIASKPACLVFPEKSCLTDIIHYMRDITSYPALYHMGYSYLCADRDGSVIGSEYKKYIDNNLLERVLRAVASYVFAIIPQSTLAKSPHMIKYKDLVKSEIYYSQCLELAEVKTFTTEDLRKLATVSVTGALNLAMSAFLTTPDPTERIKLKNDILSEMSKLDKAIRESSKASVKFEFDKNKLLLVPDSDLNRLSAQARSQVPGRVQISANASSNEPGVISLQGPLIATNIVPNVGNPSENVSTVEQVTDQVTGNVPVVETVEEINKVNESVTDSSS